MPKVNNVVEMPIMDIQKMELVLVGDTPVISHKWSEKAKKQMLDKQMKKAKQGKEAKDPWSDFCNSLYWLDGMPEDPTEEDIMTARFGLPSLQFKLSAVNACSSIDGMTKVLARQTFFINNEFVEIQGGPPEMREDMVRISMGTADIRYRGEFRNWWVRLLISYNHRVISPEQVTNLVNTAGFGVGVGDWRPEKGGQFGRWHVADSVEMANFTQEAAE